jgi:hypothetical protein
VDFKTEIRLNKGSAVVHFQVKSSAGWMQTQNGRIPNWARVTGGHAGCLARFPEITPTLCYRPPFEETTHRQRIV